VSQQLNLTINFSAASVEKRDSGELLLIEQEDWKPYTGLVTKGNMARQLASLLYSDAYQAQVDCGVMANGDVVCAVYVYKLRPDVQYQLTVTHGELAGPEATGVDVDETLHFSLDTESALKYPAATVRSAVWASAYNSDGVKVTDPAVTITSRDVTVSAPVYGSLRVQYTAQRDEYILTIPKRADAEENFYSAYLIGLPIGGRPVFLQFDPPPTAEEMAKEGTECGRGSGGDSGDATRPSHPLDDVTASKHQRTIIVDYCTQEVIVDSTA